METLSEMNSFIMENVQTKKKIQEKLGQLCSPNSTTEHQCHSSVPGTSAGEFGQTNLSLPHDIQVT
jgi:hypothetical protein